MINRLVVANRGEIARRVFATCRDLGIETVAVFSDPDTGSPHVTDADVAVRLPGAAAADTYLRGDLIVKAALEAGADAIHPGYGFLAENADFAGAVLAADLIWIGPPPSAIEAMGSKVNAKRLLAAAGVPVLPDLDPGVVTAADLPVLVKASAGGGGRGMRPVRTLRDLPDALESARREAAAAFGDPTVFCEPLLENARHVEVQVLADRHGTVWTLGERDCSIQRRHQKIIEEAPSPAVDDVLRAKLCEAASAAARAIGYVGAGTVEFLLAPDGRFYFLEVNTRLQVEHPVTECRYEIDLVRLQIEVAEGEALPVEMPVARGHAIEARLYAEDPATDYRPQSGVLHRIAVPDVDASLQPLGRYGLRLDAGVCDGQHIGVDYDPLLAKVIAWAPSREQAIRRLARALDRSRIHGVVTNRDLLVRVLQHPAFAVAETDTAFLDRHWDAEDGLPGLATRLIDHETVRLSALAAALADAAGRGGVPVADSAGRGGVPVAGPEAQPSRAAADVMAGVPSGFRNVPSQPQRKAFLGPDGEVEVAYRLTRSGLMVEGFDGVDLVAAEPDRVTLDIGGVRQAFALATYPSGRHVDVYVDSALGGVALRRLPRFRDPADHVVAGSLVAPMPGSVTAVAVEPGDRVIAGQPLLWLAAMKMEHQVTAPDDGVVVSVHVVPGQQVEVGSVLVVMSGVEPTGPTSPGEEQ